MSELKEQIGFQLDQEGCMSQLLFQFMSSCSFYLPLDNSYVSYFWKLCQNRKHSGIYLLDFKKLCGVK